MNDLLPPGHPFDDIIRILIGLAGLGTFYIASTKTWRFLRDVYHAWKWVAHTKDEVIDSLRIVRDAALLITHEFNSNGGRTESPQDPVEDEAAKNATMKDLQLDNRALLRKLSHQLLEHDGWARQDAEDTRRERTGYRIDTESPRDPDLVVGSER
jgi:hypothetical protein